MAILGHGVDITPVDRIARLIARHGDRALERLLSPAERSAAMARSGAKLAEHVAGRFAAKEAILKALGTGMAAGLSWAELEVVGDGWGRPCVRLSGRAAELAASRGINRWHVSISHAGGWACASVIAELV